VDRGIEAHAEQARLFGAAYATMPAVLQHWCSAAAIPCWRSARR
jgi:hypothetical protein